MAETSSSASEVSHQWKIRNSSDPNTVYDVKRKPVGNSIIHGAPVYEATKAGPEAEPVFIMVLDKEDTEAFNLLKNEYEKSESLGDCHTKILAVKCHFSDSFHHQYCVVLPWVSISLKSFIKTHSPGGVNERWVTVVMKDVLEAISVIHERYLIHGRLNCDSVYLVKEKGEPARLKVGYGATIIDLVTPHERSSQHWAIQQTPKDFQRPNSPSRLIEPAHCPSTKLP